MKKVYLCTDSNVGIYSAIYDAWKESRNEEVGIRFSGIFNRTLFCEYRTVQEEERKIDAVMRLIQKNLGFNAYWDIYHALLSEHQERAEAVFHVMQKARKIGDSKKIMDLMTDPDVALVFELSRAVANEAHLFVEFIRFRELENGVMFSEISPKNRVLTCIGNHFTDRFPLENWMIYDKTYKEFLVHKKGQRWVLVTGEGINMEAVRKVSAAELEYEKLWKEFFETIAIKERTNPVCQMTHLPLRFRSDMCEFVNPVQPSTTVQEKV